MSKAKPWYHDKVRYDGKTPPESNPVEKKYPSKKKGVRLVYYVRQPKNLWRRWYSGRRLYNDPTEMETVENKRKFKNERAALQALEEIKKDFNKETGWRKDSDLINYRIEDIG